MAVGLGTRIIFKKHSTTATTNPWAGTYSSLCRATSMPTPFGTPNMEDTSTLEDWTETQEKGRRTADAMEIPCAFKSDVLDNFIDENGDDIDEEYDIIILYGTTGEGDLGFCGFVGKPTFSPDEATEGFFTGTVTIAKTTQTKWLHKKYEVESVTEDDSGYLTSASIKAKTI